MVVDLQPSRGALSVILDTEIGGEPDDAMALVVAARELPELALVVTSDELGGGQRARFARYLLDTAGRADVAVVAGHQLSANPSYFADGLTPDWVPPASGDVARAVAEVCARSGGVARWIGLGPLSNLATLLAREPGLERRLFVTQLTGTWSEFGQALPPRNFRLDPAAASQVLASMHHLRLVSYELSAGQQAQLTAASPVIRELAGAAPSWAGPLAAHCGQFFARYHPAVIPAGPLALAAALRLGFAPFGPARVTVDGSGWIKVTRPGTPRPETPRPGTPGPETPRAGATRPEAAVPAPAPRQPADAQADVLISREVDYRALADWLSTRLRPGVWAQWARPPGLSRSGAPPRHRAHA
ncbi:MAG TPA: nucleoside hydrolase [Streptosporangiaceae bacterium]|nr:nucleoside hydrolase [Streptosporangiaceae bacterium]